MNMTIDNPKSIPYVVETYSDMIVQIAYATYFVPAVKAEYFEN